MFVGRVEELKKLEEMYRSKQFEFAVIYGRRRIGKTTLIKEFIKNKKAIFFMAREADSSINLAGFSNDVYGVVAKELAGNAQFSDWESALDFVARIAKRERIVLAIDEYPYLAGGFSPISSLLQAHIDQQFKDTRLFLILSGSSMSFMENQVLAYKSPLYGRRTAQFKISPFSFFEALPFFEGFEAEDKATLYGAVGGVPEYLSKLNSKRTVKQNIIELFLTPSGHFFEEPSNLLKQELRDPSTYNTIIEAIAYGASRLSEISSKSGLESNKCGKYIKSLIELGLVKKEVPVFETSSRKSIYRLDDFMFRFWYRFVFPNLSAIVSGLGNQVYEAEVRKNLSSYMGSPFEDICKQFLVEEAKRGNLPFLLTSVGKWWGNNPLEKRQEEIDLLAYHETSALFVECKWTNALVGADALHDLEAQSKMFAFANKWFLICAKRGFKQSLISGQQNDDRLRLVTLMDMIDKVGKNVRNCL